MYELVVIDDDNFKPIAENVDIYSVKETIGPFLTSGASSGYIGTIELRDLNLTFSALYTVKEGALIIYLPSHMMFYRGEYIASAYAIARLESGKIYIKSLYNGKIVAKFVKKEVE